MWSIERLGHKVYPVNTSNYFYDAGKWFRRIGGKLNQYTDLRMPNRKMVRGVRANDIDLVWVDKGLKVKASTLQQIKAYKPAIKIISYSPDDMMNPANQTRRYLESIPFYDLHVTTKSYNVDELTDLGAKNCLFVNNAFESEIHKPQENLAGTYLHDVSFVGGWEEERSESIQFLAENGVEVVWYCNSWPLARPVPKKLKIKPAYLKDLEYAAVLQQSRINLCFLRKWNRDVQTQRSVEIPACGGFMLAERTKEHQNLFREGAEADYFGSNEELLEKVRYYLGHEKERACIADAGRFKCLDAEYSNEGVAKKIIDHVENLGAV
jgi:hypothetical protein